MIAGKGDVELLFNGHRVLQRWEDEQGLEMDGCGGGTTVGTYVMVLTCALKYGYNGQFYVRCILIKQKG